MSRFKQYVSKFSLMYFSSLFIRIRVYLLYSYSILSKKFWKNRKFQFFVCWREFSYTIVEFCRIINKSNNERYCNRSKKNLLNSREWNRFNDDLIELTFYKISFYRFFFHKKHKIWNEKFKKINVNFVNQFDDILITQMIETFVSYIENVRVYRETNDEHFLFDEI